MREIEASETRKLEKCLRALAEIITVSPLILKAVIQADRMRKH